MKRAEDHLLLATKARSYLKSQVAKAKEEIKTNFLDKGEDVPFGSSERDIEIHYSFDFAQQVSPGVQRMFLAHQ